MYSRTFRWSVLGNFMKIFFLHIALILILADYSVSQSSGYVPGNSYWGKGRFVEYVAGDLPIIITVPHGGNLKPEIIPDRTFGVNAKDNGTQEIVRDMIVEFKKRTGKIPHVIFSHLLRKKLDVNREEFEAAQENPSALSAWNDYHGFIEQAKASSKKMYGKGFLIDLHGQNHPEQRIEIGYRLENDELMLADSDLNTVEYVEKSSLKNLVKTSALSHSELIRGKNSLGALFDKRSVRSTPSPSDPAPKSYKFFGGGYTVFRHAVEDTAICGVQLELNTELRLSGHCESTAGILVDVIVEYLDIHFGENFAERMK
jgi:hypothetical protein